ncbi:MAG TPA: hypothetical protein VHL57_08465 [Flavobacteriales bacterium]|nr:hypothetical protein [Flavobacteriales bacterium]
MSLRFPLFLSLSTLLVLGACKKDDDDNSTPTPTPTPSGPRLVLKFKFDSTQVRLNNIGLPSTVPAGHGAQSPRFNKMSAHYVEFAPSPITALGAGDVVYHAPETTAGGPTAIDFSQSVKVGNGETFLNIPLSELSAGTYTWLRVSLAYQNYDIDFRYNDTQFGFGIMDLDATVASFIGYNTYITSFPVHDQTITVNDDRLQGFWAFEVTNAPFTVPAGSGQAPPGATTVVNPIFATSPIPAGSCVVTGAFAAPLVITGTETEDVVITVSLSTNKSFEWSDDLGDNIYEPLAGDTVVDMGVRGMIPIVE